ncbi:MAG: protein-L-isoaspartate(D-aspartate) O-methyltransferase [Spirochaetales bacterium]|nr:protein-L-isoaspartate(D-aspartate) O-methyltransferase [Spirochaetales bacterium]
MLLCVVVVTGSFCRGRGETAVDSPEQLDGSAAGAIEFEEDRELTEARSAMVETQIRTRGIDDPRVLEAMRRVPRHLFMPEDMQRRAYEDHPVPIGEGQTISQPYIVALMTESLALDPNHRVLEIGTGSGYQAAVLSLLAELVFTIEIREILYKRSAEVLKEIGLANVTTLHADGYYGWEQFAPFDSIMITAAVDHIPRALLDQLTDGGRLILPLGDPFGFQDLVMVIKDGSDFSIEYVTGVIFVPMTGKALK